MSPWILYFTIVFLGTTLIFSALSVFIERKSPLKLITTENGFPFFISLGLVVCVATLIGFGITMGSTSKSIDTGKTSVIIDNISYSFVKSVYEVTDLKESNYDKDIPSLEDNNKLMITKNGISILVTGENKSSTKVVKNKDIKVPRIVITTTTSQTTNAISNSPDEGKKTDYEIQIPNVQ